MGRVCFFRCFIDITQCFEGVYAPLRRHSMMLSTGHISPLSFCLSSDITQQSDRWIAMVTRLRPNV